MNLRQHIQAIKIAISGGVLLFVDVILHIGAHRTGTTTFQQYLENNRDHLHEIGTQVWGPKRTRAGLFSGLVKKPTDISDATVRRGDRSNGLIRMEMDRLAQAGVKSLIVSEENMFGTMWNNLQTAQLYPETQARLDRFSAGFGFARKRIALSVRSYDKYWASVLAFMIKQGWRAPDTAFLDRLVTQPRRWRDVIRDVAAVFPAAELVVWPFEGFVGQSDNQLALINNGAVPAMMRGQRDWHNASPSCAKLRQIFLDRGNHAAAFALPNDYSRWQPFSDQHIAALRSQYDDDIAWLRRGADGMATYIEGGSAGIHLRPVQPERGHFHDQEARSVG